MRVTLPAYKKSQSRRQVIRAFVASWYARHQDDRPPVTLAKRVDPDISRLRQETETKSLFHG